MGGTLGHLIGLHDGARLIQCFLTLLANFFGKHRKLVGLEAWNVGSAQIAGNGFMPLLISFDGRCCLLDADIHRFCLRSRWRAIKAKR